VDQHEAQGAGRNTVDGTSTVSRFHIIEAEQRTDEWRAARAGRATGSKADCVLAKIKTGEAAMRRNYRTQLVAERLTGRPQDDGYTSKEMLRGIELEPMARAAYEARTGLLVRETGFLSMREHLAGCSLDGDIDEFTGLVSFKCPNSANHVEYLRRRRLPPEYVPQATHEMWVTGAKWYDFCSFDDRFPENLQLLVVRVERNEFDIAGYESELLRFLAEVQKEHDELKGLRIAA
jgi:hypothetical protein